MKLKIISLLLLPTLMLLLAGCGRGNQPSDSPTTSTTATFTPAPPTATPIPTQVPPTATLVAARTPTQTPIAPPTPAATPTTTATQVTPTAIPVSTPSPTPKLPTPTSEPSWQYIGFTHAPIDFQQTLVEAQECTRDTMLMPFFNYLNSNHAEGPKKWYIKACPGEPVKVYLPAKASLQEKSIRISGNAEVYNGDKILTDVQVYFEASADITLFFMHLALLDDVRSKVEASSTGVAVFEAGDHIGYVYAPSQGTYSLDFGVADKKVDAGLTENAEHWWNIRANPLDYFTEEVRQTILQAYDSTLQRLVNDGYTAFADLKDSRLNINEDGKIWGVWFKDDLSNAFSGDAGYSGSAWSVINMVKLADLTQSTYWKAIEKYPGLSGLFVEADRKQVVGQFLYEGGPIGENRFFILSGNNLSGVARIEDRRTTENPRAVYLKYEVTANSESKMDDTLLIEGFVSQNAAEMSAFSSKAVHFRRPPCQKGASGCL